MKVIEGGVTAAKGYKAAGLRAGIKAGKTNKDMAMIYSEKQHRFSGIKMLYIKKERHRQLL